MSRAVLALVYRRAEVLHKRRRSMDKSNEKTTAGERIAKVMARAGLCSRREAEAWIAAGRVAINGRVINSPAVNVTGKDQVAVDGQALPALERTRLFLYHKPRGLVTTNADPQGRPTIFAALPKNLPRLISVGRLDINTEGLLLLTNDGGLARALELPETGWLRRYRVRAFGSVTQARLNDLRRGITVNGVRYGAIEATLDRAQASNVWLTFAIREGKNREVRNVLEALDLKVARLIRVSFGPFQLGDLKPGEIEEVATRHLREQLGERLAELASADFTAPIVQRADAPLHVPKLERSERPSREHPTASRHRKGPALRTSKGKERFASRREGGGDRTSKIPGEGKVRREKLHGRPGRPGSGQAADRAAEHGTARHSRRRKKK